MHVVTLVRVHADRAFDRKSIPKSEIKVKLVEKINILVTGSMSFTKEGKKWDRGSNPCVSGSLFFFHYSVRSTIINIEILPSYFYISCYMKENPET